jgi:hypothetical protein
MTLLRLRSVAPLGLLLLISLPSVAHAQQGETVLTLPSVIEDAAKNYPAIQISQEELNAAGARIQLARTAYLPRVDALAQFNRGTRNNVFGSLLPQGIIPSMSGPVIGTNNGGSVWGSAAGILINWQPFDLEHDPRAFVRHRQGATAPLPPTCEHNSKWRQRLPMPTSQ